VLRIPDENRTCPTPSRRDVVISGLGPVSAIGVGIADWTAALRTGRSGIEPDETIGGGTCVAGPPSLGHRTFADRSLWRHMNRLSRLSIAATRLAWEDSGIAMSKAELNEVGLVFATASGSIESTKGFDDSVAADPSKPAVLSFSNVVLNATGGAVCQTMGLRGPTTTICQGGASASIALDCAVETVRSGKAEVMLVLAADEYSAATVHGRIERGELSSSGAVRPYDRGRDGTAPGAAAAALVVESAEHCAARGGRPYAEVLGTAHVGHVAGESAHDHIARGITRALALTDRPVDLVVGAADGRAADVDEATAAQSLIPKALLTAPASVTGDCAAASGVFNVIVAALAVRDGLVPATAGLVDPAVGTGQEAERFVTGAHRTERVNVSLALTRADGSVCGHVLLGEPA
jgi:3-oxoacyl-[acyl-carrier-protein] synthase II